MCMAGWVGGRDVRGVVGVGVLGLFFGWGDEVLNGLVVGDPERLREEKENETSEESPLPLSILGPEPSPIPS